MPAIIMLARINLDAVAFEFAGPRSDNCGVRLGIIAEDAGAALQQKARGGRARARQTDNGGGRVGEILHCRVAHGRVSVTTAGAAICSARGKEHRFVVASASLWRQFGVALASLWRRFGVASASLRRRFGVASASLRRRFGVASASLRRRFGVASASLRRRFGVASASLRRRFGVASASLRRRFGVALSFRAKPRNISTPRQWN